MSAPTIPLTSAGRLRGPRSIAALILRETATANGRIPGGYIWAVAEPVAVIALLSAGFALMFRTPPLGTSFPLYFATGYLPYAMVLDLAGRVAGAIRHSRPLLTYPGVTWGDAVLARLTLGVLTHLTTGAIVFAGLAAAFDLPLTVDMPALACGVAMAILLGGGLGLTNAALFHLLPVCEPVWRVATRPLVIVSGVIFFFDTMPVPLRDWLWWNPLVHVVAEIRRGFFPTYSAGWVTPAYVAGLGLGFTVFGLVLLHRHHRAMIHG